MRAYQLRPLAAKRCRKGDGSASSPAPAGKALGQPDRAICRARKHAPAPDVIAPPSNPAPTARRPACKFEQLWVTLCGIGALRIGKKLLRYNSFTHSPRRSQNVRPVHFGEILPAYERTADTITCGSGTDSGEAPGPLRLDLTAPGPPRRAGSGGDNVGRPSTGAYGRGLRARAGTVARRALFAKKTFMATKTVAAQRAMYSTMEFSVFHNPPNRRNTIEAMRVPVLRPRLSACPHRHRKP